MLSQGQATSALSRLSYGATSLVAPNHQNLFRTFLRDEPTEYSVREIDKVGILRLRRSSASLHSGYAQDDNSSRFATVMLSQGQATSALSRLSYGVTSLVAPHHQNLFRTFLPDEPIEYPVREIDKVGILRLRRSSASLHSGYAQDDNSSRFATVMLSQRQATSALSRLVRAACPHMNLARPKQKPPLLAKAARSGAPIWSFVLARS